MLRRLMAQDGLNANQLADRLKVSPQLVRDWEQGRKKTPLWIQEQAQFRLEREGILRKRR